MKKIFWKMASALLIGLAIASCKDPAEEIVPVFPEQVNHTVEPGESYTWTISPNLPWEVSISGDTQYFRMISDGEPLPSVSGQAGEHELTVEAIVDETDFDQRQCTLKMTMAGKEEVIAVITRNGRDRIFNVYPVIVGNDGFEWGDNGYQYAAEPAVDFSLYFDGNIFQTYMKVEANFDWALKDFPEWVDAVELEGRYVTSGKANVPAVVCLRGVNEKYPLDGESGKLGFIVNYNPDEPVAVETEITLSIEAVKNIFTVSAPDAVRFNAAGDYYNDMMGDWQPGMSAKGEVIGVDGVQVFAVAKSDYGYYEVVGISKPNPSISGWVNISISADDEKDVLKTWNYAITVSENTGSARSAEIIVVPGTVTVSDPEYDLFTPDASEISGNFTDYVCTVLNQEGKGGNVEGGMVSADADKLANAGAKLEFFDLLSMGLEDLDGIFNVGLDNYYMLTVTKPQGHYELKYAKEIWNAVPYFVDDNGMPAGYGENFPEWIAGMDDKSFDFIFTDNDIYNMFFLVLQTGDANYELENFAVIVVTYDPWAEIVGGGNALAFAYPDNVRGASLSKLSSGNELYEYIHSELWCSEIYELTYTTATPSMAFINTTLDYTRTIYLDDADASWLSLSEEDHNPFLIMMSGNEARQGVLVFQDTSEGYPMTSFAVVCTLAL